MVENDALPEGVVEGVVDGRRQARRYRALGRRHHWQAVGPTAAVIKFLRGGKILHLVGLGRKRDQVRLHDSHPAAPA